MKDVEKRWNWLFYKIISLNNFQNSTTNSNKSANPTLVYCSFLECVRQVNKDNLVIHFFIFMIIIIFGYESFRVVTLPVVWDSKYM